MLFRWEGNFPFSGTNVNATQLITLNRDPARAIRLIAQIGKGSEQRKRDCAMNELGGAK
jgi:hypothetical protein